MAKVPIPSEYQGLPVVTSQQMKEMDVRAMRDYKIAPLFLMEKAGKGVADGVASFIESNLGKGVGQSLVAVFCGRGNNGGDGLVAARYLHSMGARVKVFLVPPKIECDYSLEVKENLSKAESGGVEIVRLLRKDQIPMNADSEAGPRSAKIEKFMRESGLDPRDMEEVDVCIDALLGTGSSGKPAGVVKKMIYAMMKSGRPIIAIDIPSGLNPDSGYHSGAFVSAKITLTLALPKRGLLAVHAQRNVGEIKVIDIGFPKEMLKVDVDAK